MQPEKKISKEDTWKADDLRRHIRGGGHEEDHGRRREEYERKHRGGESVERRQRDPEREARRERDKRRERDGTRERANPRDGEKGRHLDRSTEASRDRTGEREEREIKREKDRGVVNSKYKGGDRENVDRRHGTEEKENREKDREREKTREREMEKERTRDRERGEQRDRDKGREERDREKRREEREKERRAERERDRDGKRGEGGRGGERQHEREKRDGHRGKEYLKEGERHKDESQDKRKDREGRERHADRERREGHKVREHPAQKEDKEHREQRRKEREERERRHKERKPLDPAEDRRHGGESKEVVRDKGSESGLHGDRERAEMGKRGERRHREGGDLEGDHAETGSTKRSSSHRDHKTVKTKVGKEEAPAQDQAEEKEAQEYEEDFEDYEEDFEDVDESDGEEDKWTRDREERGKEEELSPRGREEVEAIQRAMDEENERVGSAQTRLSAEEGEGPRRTKDPERSLIKTPRQGKFIDFVAAKHREVSKKVASKQKKRSTELLRLIDLDFSITFSLLDLPPVNEYDMYIKTFGTSNTKQAYVQCNEDNIDRDVQTEDSDVTEKWTQHPAERNGVCGGPNLSQEDNPTSKTNIDSQRLAKFLCSATQVVAVLLEEERAELQSHQKLKTQEDKLSFSDGSLQLNTKLPFLQGRPVSLLRFSQAQRHNLLSVHGPSGAPAAVRLDAMTVICVWNIWEPSRPQKILVYESEVRSCCFSPGRATLVLAGTAVGSVVLWDLREHAGTHIPLRTPDGEWTLRHPTFSTDAVLATSGHVSPVSSMEAVPSSAAGLSLELPLLVADEESSGLSFQLASLDENGILNLWVVVELPKASEAGSQTDLGLRPGGKVKLLHSSTLHTGQRNSVRDAVKTGPTQTLLLKFLPSDSSQFFIGTNMGLVSHGATHGLKAPPKFYRPQEVGARPVDVTSISFSPFGEACFLVGCGDGSVRLHAVASEQPIMEWSSSTAGEPVVALQWAQTRPTVFCVLDSASCLHLWDLQEKDAGPVFTEKTGADGVTAMAVFGDPSKQNTFSGIALARQSGKIELQYFTKRFTVAVPADLEKLQSLMEEAF